MKGQIIHKHLYSSGLKVGAQASRYAHVKKMKTESNVL
jgi:hypothetical protein